MYLKCFTWCLYPSFVLWTSISKVNKYLPVMRFKPLTGADRPTLRNVFCLSRTGVSSSFCFVNKVISINTNLWDKSDACHLKSGQPLIVTAESLDFSQYCLSSAGGDVVVWHFAARDVLALRVRCFPRSSGLPVITSLTHFTLLHLEL